MLATLAATEQELTLLTDGAGAADVLAEFARASALELAQFFDDMRGLLFTGLVPRASGWRAWLRRSRRVRHRVLAVRYTFADPALSIGSSMSSYDVMGFLLAIGEDGILRTGEVNESISIDATATIPDTPLLFSDERVRNVPTSPTKLSPWTGGNDPSAVASAEVVLDVLRHTAAQLHEQKQAQGTLLRRLLGR